MTTITEKWLVRDKEVVTSSSDVFSLAGYECGDCLGIGATSEVFKVRNLRSGKMYAAKRPIRCNKGSSATTGYIKREIWALKNLSHGHILHFVNEYHSPDKSQHLLITELCKAGTLQDLIDRSDRALPTEQALQCIIQVTDALKYMHGNGLYHSDLKPRNIFVRGIQPMDVVLGDLADAKKLNTFAMVRGTKAYYSPQMIETGVHCGPSDDIWALGITALGIVHQWPRLKHTEEELKDYPAACHSHVRKLWSLNEGNGIVRLLVMMLGWMNRSDARECRDAAMELREMLEDGEEWVIKSPVGFQASVFW